MTKEVIILNFDDDTIECKTFVVVNDPEFTIDRRFESVHTCGYDSIKRDYKSYIPLIKEAIKQGKHYIGFTKPVPKDKALSFGETEAYMEIQWD